MEVIASRPVRRRILAAKRKSAKRCLIQPAPNPHGNRAERRFSLRHTHTQDRMKGSGWTRENIERAKERRASAKKQRNRASRKVLAKA